MNLVSNVIRFAEEMPITDVIIRHAVKMMVASTSQKLQKATPLESARFAAAMSRFPIATHTTQANHQHYEVPAAFFELVLGPRRKYSCCLYPTDKTTLAQAEEFALIETAKHADLADGQEILELGCGWGSLALWMGRTFPAARITAVSNSNSQREFIRRKAAEQGLRNLEVVTKDINLFRTDRKFDRVVSVEMFEHMSNWRALLQSILGWLKFDGRLFVHVFAHRNSPYRFDDGDESDWIARNFFTGGIMPSRTLMHQFKELFVVENEWQWSGTHYARTARDWLANQDARAEEVLSVITPTYGDSAKLWYRRWRFFFLATEGLFSHNDGSEWNICQYRLKPA